MRRNGTSSTELPCRSVSCPWYIQCEQGCQLASLLPLGLNRRWAMGTLSGPDSLMMDTAPWDPAFHESPFLPSCIEKLLLSQATGECTPAGNVSCLQVALTGWENVSSIIVAISTARHTSDNCRKRVCIWQRMAAGLSVLCCCCCCCCCSGPCMGRKAPVS